MADIEILEQDRVDAENLIAQVLTDQVTKGDFGKGGALRDLAVTALSTIFAYIQKERDITRARQSLLLLEAILDQADVDTAVDEILSNWFLTRKEGRKSSGVATLYFSQKFDVNVPVTAAFFKSSALVFYPNTTETVYSISEDDMTAVVDDDGIVTAYSARIPLVAAEVGAVYDIASGPFIDFSRFSPYLMKVENASEFRGGDTVEASEAMLARAETAISARTLVSPRGIDSLLKEEFATIDDVVVIGHGDAEMIRDIVGAEIANARIHVGGHTDIYLRTQLLEDQTYSAEVGDEFTDPRPGYFILRDFRGTDYAAAGVVRGDIIFIQNAYAVEPDKYIVNEVTPYGVFVSRRAQFPSALPTVDNTTADGAVGPTHTGTANLVAGGSYAFTATDVDKYVRIKNSTAGNDGTYLIQSVDTILNRATVAGVTLADENPVAFDVESRIVRYSIGDNSPLFTNKVAIDDEGAFTKTIQRDGRVLMPALPIYRVTGVYATDAGHARADVDGRVWFNEQINVPPTAVTGTDPLTFRLIGNNPEEVYSAWQVLELELGFTAVWAAANPGDEFKEFNGKPVTIVYDTIISYDDIWQYVVNDANRNVDASVIPKGLHAVFLDMEIQYKTAKSATAGLDTAAAKEALTEYINNFDTREDMDSSDIITFLRTTYDVIGYIEPITINYQLMSPDGRVIYYQTEDTVHVEATKHRYPTESNKCLDPTAAAPYNSSAISLGISDNTVRYLTAIDLITFTEI